MKVGMFAMSFRSLIASAVMVVALLALPRGAQAETLDCLISRGNLCFSTGCDNSGKSQRMVLDLGAGSTFTVWLPVADDSLIADEQTAPFSLAATAPSR